jgi:hypothetical protein
MEIKIKLKKQAVYSKDESAGICTKFVFIQQENDLIKNKTHAYVHVII